MLPFKLEAQYFYHFIKGYWHVLIFSAIFLYRNEFDKYILINLCHRFMFSSLVRPSCFISEIIDYGPFCEFKLLNLWKFYNACSLWNGTCRNLPDKPGINKKKPTLLFLTESLSGNDGKKKILSLGQGAGNRTVELRPQTWPKGSDLVNLSDHNKKN